MGDQVVSGERGTEKGANVAAVTRYALARPLYQSSD
jgi:hypothetical protein